eukprot:scaffold2971_cov1256-Pavlova_lutheri.AAC.1
MDSVTLIGLSTRGTARSDRCQNPRRIGVVSPPGRHTSTHRLRPRSIPRWLPPPRSDAASGRHATQFHAFRRIDPLQTTYLGNG